jgi:hypothetical protein
LRPQEQLLVGRDGRCGQRPDEDRGKRAMEAFVNPFFGKTRWGDRRL